MSRIESEAQAVLIRRRESLRRGPATAALPSDPAGSWADDEEPPEPLSEGVRRELAEIEAALARIAEGGYGRCLSCGGPIGLQRLRAIPEARYCVACSSQPSPPHARG